MVAELNANCLFVHGPSLPPQARQVLDEDRSRQPMIGAAVHDP